MQSTAQTGAPLIVQRDFSVLADTHVPAYETVRPLLARFAELLRSPEHIHFYRITPLSLWNAAATGMSLDEIVDVLGRYSRVTLPPDVVTGIAEYVGRYGKLAIEDEDGTLVLRSEDPALLDRVANDERIKSLLGPWRSPDRFEVHPGLRGDLKQALVELGFPPHDLAGYVDGTPLQVELRRLTATGREFKLRPYQAAAVDAFYAGGSARGGSGVIVLPCGAGKTIVGLGVIGAAQTHTLILCPNTVALRQWIAELLDKTTLRRDDVGEYSAERKEIRPITLATYQILTYRPFAVDQNTGEVGDFPHMRLLRQADWGLLIYDEVHLLPAPVFRATAELQARRRLGLTATLVREDGRERDVFALIGPKKYDLPWRDLEHDGFIAQALCIEVRVEMDAERRMEAVLSENRQDAYRIAAENPRKLDVLEALAQRHHGDHVLVIGQYLDQLTAIARRLDAPLLTGKTPTRERERLYAAFKRGEAPILVVSKIANFALDLPDA
ncbi:MAG: DEAD/DEAH box helicase, partial [Chloroflexota bacterium]|nr:DEAD/DEAH box helicase [Chloroflexota bacterium]